MAGFNVAYINPFVEAVYDLFNTMLGCTPVKGEICAYRELPQTNDIVALIGLSGPVRGTVALTFPVKTSLAVIGRLLNTELKVVDAILIDGVAEVVNIVAGSAKSRLHDGTGKPIDLSLPSVLRGSGIRLDHPGSCPWIEVPFDSDLGSFQLRVTFESTVAVA